jgi:hypothetical protein
MVVNGGGTDCIVQLGILILTAYMGHLHTAGWAGTTQWTVHPPQWAAN